MSRNHAPFSASVQDEVVALTATLHRTEQRLAELTEGQVDAVSDRDGRVLLLRRAQEQLRSSEAAKQSAILSALPAHVALLDAQGFIITVNEAWRQYAGANAFKGTGSGIGQSYLEVCDRTRGDEAFTAQQVAKGIRSVLSGRADSYLLDYPCDSASERRWFRLSATPLRTDIVGAGVGGAVVMHVDISELKAGEESLRRSAELLQAVVGGTPDMVFVNDLDGRFLMCNEAAARFAGRTVRQMIGQDAAALFEPATAAVMKESDRRVIEGGVTTTTEEVITGADRTLTVLMTKIAHRNERGEVIGVIGCVRDISERRQAERDRDRERQSLRTLIDALPDLVYTKDTDGRYVVANRAMLALFGMHDEAEMLGKTAADIVPAELAARVREADLQVLAGQSVFNRRESSRAADGSPRHHLTTKVPLRDAESAVSGYVCIKRDITDITRDQEALRQSQALLSMAGRLAHVGGWSLELPATRMVWSDTLAAIHDEPPGLSPTMDQALAYCAPEHAPLIRAAVHKCIEEGTPFDAEHEIITALGRRIWVRAIGEAVRGEGGAILRIQGALQDLSERKRAEQATQRLSQRLASTLESIPDGFLSLDREWRFTYLNSEAERMLRLDRGQVLNRVVWELVPDIVGTEFERGYRRAMDGEKGVALEAFCAPWNAWISVNCYPSDEGLTIHFRDTTRTRAAHRQLELLQASVSQLNDMVLIAEVSSDNERLRTVFVNDALLHNTGYTREELLGRSPLLLHGPQTEHCDVERLRAEGDRFEPVHVELVNYRKNGEPFWVDLDIVPVAVDGAGHSHLVSVMRDISGRKRDQDALRELNAELEARVCARTAEANMAREEAEQANRAKSAFLASMSHEIRTPMNGVIGMVDVLHQTSLKDYQVEMVDLIRDSAYSLLSIIEGILDFSKIEAGKLTVSADSMELAGVVEKVCGMLDLMAVKSGVRLTTFVDPAIPRLLAGDEARLRQVLVNLTANAIKFSAGRERAGQVSVRAVPVQHQGSVVTLDLIVADNGIGMDAATLATLFKPFVQADASTTRRFGGTGLGLAISSMLVDLMGGAISVRSTPGEGSTFTVRLTLAEVNGQEEDSCLPSPITALRCRIVGLEKPFADDLEAYLCHAGVIVERSPHLAAAALEPRPAGLCLWLVLPGQAIPKPEELRALARGGAASQTHFVVLGRGTRRRPFVEAPDFVTVDAEMLTRRTLYRAVALAAGRIQDEGAWSDEDSSASAHSPSRECEQARLGGKLILVAEDNETNRKVIAQQMQLLGLPAEMVVNGREALGRWRSGDFALLLTDLHMPEMDGYALTAAIRAEESAGHHTPIIALTANALRNEEQRCRAAGMDAYLTKPVLLQQLKAAIESWLGEMALPTARCGSDRCEVRTLPADLSVLTALIGNDPSVISEVIHAFKASAAQSSAELARGLGAGQQQAMAAAAHKLKSGARSIGAARLGGICEEIEQAAEAGRSTELGELLPMFETELGDVNRFLDSR